MRYKSQGGHELSNDKLRENVVRKKTVREINFKEAVSNTVMHQKFMDKISTKNKNH